MYSGGWEVVGKNRKDKNLVKIGKLSKAEKKKFIENAPKVEDFLPLDQVKTLYDNLEGNKENKNPMKEKEIKPKDNEEKKKQKQSIEKKKDETQKRKLPKSIENALGAINLIEVQNLISTNQENFPDAPLIWLKSLAAYLNAEIPVEKDDPLFSGKPQGYPLSVVPKNLRVTLEKAIESAGASNAKIFYEFILTAMAMEMAKGTPVIGFKIFIQLLAKYDPKLSSSNIAKLISMRNSYQNRKPIGLSLLWSFNQGGQEDLNVGLKIWHEVMVTLLEAKSYSSYILQLLDDLVSWHGNNDSLQIDLYISIFEDFFSGKLNISNSVIEEGISKLKKLRIILFQNKNINYRKLFETLLLKISPKTPQGFKEEILNVLINCLSLDDRCFEVWKSQYMKQLFASNMLLTHIDSIWSSSEVTFNSTLLSDLISAFQLSYEKSKKGKGKDDKYLYTCISMSKALHKKMVSTKASKKGGLPWKTGCFLILVLASSIFAYEIHKQGSFEATSTGKFLKNIGATAYAQKTLIFIKIYHAKSLEYFETNYPEYYKTVINFSTPYIHLAGDLYLISKNFALKLSENVAFYINEQSPVIKETIEHYIPGVLESTQKNSLKALETIKIYSGLIVEQTIETSVTVTVWLKTNIFVGKLSPESLEHYTKQALNSTHNFAKQTYSWVYKKVQTLSKVE